MRRYGVDEILMITGDVVLLNSARILRFSERKRGFCRAKEGHRKSLFDLGQTGFCVGEGQRLRGRKSKSSGGIRGGSPWERRRAWQ